MNAGAEGSMDALDFSQPLNVQLLEQVVTSVYQGTSPDQVCFSRRCRRCHCCCYFRAHARARRAVAPRPFGPFSSRAARFGRPLFLWPACVLPGEITHFTSLLCSLALSRSQINQAQRLLSQLQERISGEEASSALNWFRVDMILESTSLTANTKFYALQILESAIKYRWKTLPAEQCNGIKSFVVNLVIARSSQEDTIGQRLFTNKLNVILVQVVKQEWPHNWPSFISDIVNASKTNETLCENNMIILKLLSEEVFDFSRDEMTSAKAKKLRRASTRTSR